MLFAKCFTDAPEEEFTEIFRNYGLFFWPRPPFDDWGFNAIQGFRTINGVITAIAGAADEDEG